jgi:hypothetical protein
MVMLSRYLVKMFIGSGRGGGSIDKGSGKKNFKGIAEADQCSHIPDNTDHILQQIAVMNIHGFSNGIDTAPPTDL